MATLWRWPSRRRAACRSLPRRSAIRRRRRLDSAVVPGAAGARSRLDLRAGVPPPDPRPPCAGYSPGRSRSSCTSAATGCCSACRRRPAGWPAYLDLLEARVSRWTGGGVRRRRGGQRASPPWRSSRGGHVRVGLEDHMPTKARPQRELVAEVVELCRSAGGRCLHRDAPKILFGVNGQAMARSAGRSSRSASEEWLLMFAADCTTATWGEPGVDELLTRVRGPHLGPQALPGRRPPPGTDAEAAAKWAGPGSSAIVFHPPVNHRNCSRARLRAAPGSGRNEQPDLADPGLSDPPATSNISPSFPAGFDCDHHVGDSPAQSGRTGEPERPRRSAAGQAARSHSLPHRRRGWSPRNVTVSPVQPRPMIWIASDRHLVVDVDRRQPWPMTCS